MEGPMEDPYVNEVALVGRLADRPVRRELPSGGSVLAWRLIIDRPRRDGGRRVVDTIPCARFGGPSAGPAAEQWRAGDLVEVHGALRRRFWRGGESGRFEVEVHAAELLAVAAPAVPAVSPGAR